MERRGMLLLCGVLLAGCGHVKQAVTEPEASEATLTIIVTGLPDGTPARVRVLNPAGVMTAYSSSVTLTHLVPGTYAVAAGYVNAASQTFTASPAPNAVNLADNDTTAVTVAYTGQPATTLDLQVGHVQLIQSTQRSDGSIPMIANRDVLVRVFATANGSNAAQPPVRVRLFQGGVQVDSLTVLAGPPSVATAVDTGSLTNSWNLLIPAARVVSGASLQVEVDPDDFIPETSKNNNRWPGGSGTTAVTVHPVPPFALRLIPVRQVATNTTGAANESNKETLARTTRSLYPLSASTVTVRSAFSTMAPALEADDGNNSWGQILNEISALRASDQSASYYVGVVPVSYGGGIAGLGYIGFPAAIAWDHAGASGVIAHELGHNFGRQHTPCGGPANPDLAYPYPGAVVGTWGMDVERMIVKAPSVQKDLMSYCDPAWVGDYTYIAVLNYRDAEAAVASSALAIDGLLVWGRVVQGKVFLEPAIRVHAPAKLPTGGGANSLEGFGAEGQRLFQISFDGDLVPDLPRGNERHFAYVIPLSEGEHDQLASLRVRGAGMTAERRPPAAIRQALRAAPPTATISADGVIRWAREYPLAVIRDASTGEILSYAREGQFPGERSQPVTVELSDGVTSRVVTTVRSPPAP